MCLQRPAPFSLMLFISTKHRAHLAIFALSSERVALKQLSHRHRVGNRPVMATCFPTSQFADGLDVHKRSTRILETPDDLAQRFQYFCWLAYSAHADRATTSRPTLCS